jgi:hypothetical protein
MTKLLVELDGQAVPLADLFWVRYTPDGCATGSLHGDMASSEEQAHTEFTPRRRDRERETRQGYRHELVTKDTWDREVRPCISGKCTHREAS